RERPAEGPPLQARERPGLGTAFGEARESQVVETMFVRARPGQPDQVVTLRYNDRPGLIALGIDVDAFYGGYASELYLRETAHPFENEPSRFAPPPPGWIP